MTTVFDKSNQFSLLTLAALADFGYPVIYENADYYRVPQKTSLRGAAVTQNEEEDDEADDEGHNHRALGDGKFENCFVKFSHPPHVVEYKPNN